MLKTKGKGGAKKMLSLKKAKRNESGTSSDTSVRQGNISKFFQMKCSPIGNNTQSDSSKSEGSEEKQRCNQDSKTRLSDASNCTSDDGALSHRNQEGYHAWTNTDECFSSSDDQVDNERSHFAKASGDCFVSPTPTSNTKRNHRFQSSPVQDDCAIPPTPPGQNLATNSKGDGKMGMCAKKTAPSHLADTSTNRNLTPKSELSHNSNSTRRNKLKLKRQLVESVHSSKINASLGISHPTPTLNMHKSGMNHKIINEGSIIAKVRTEKPTDQDQETYGTLTKRKTHGKQLENNGKPIKKLKTYGKSTEHLKIHGKSRKQLETRENVTKNLVTCEKSTKNFETHGKLKNLQNTRKTYKLSSSKKLGASMTGQHSPMSTESPILSSDIDDLLACYGTPIKGVDSASSERSPALFSDKCSSKKLGASTSAKSPLSSDVDDLLACYETPILDVNSVSLEQSPALFSDKCSSKKLGVNNTVGHSPMSAKSPMLSSDVDDLLACYGTSTEGADLTSLKQRPALFNDNGPKHPEMKLSQDRVAKERTGKKRPGEKGNSPCGKRFSSGVSNPNIPDKYTTVAATTIECEDFLDISMNSLNHEDVNYLVDAITWSPIPKTDTAAAHAQVTVSKKQISPAKSYTRSKSEEVQSLTAKQFVKRNLSNMDTAREGCRSLLVLEVYRREILDDDVTCHRGSSEKVLRLFDESDNSEKYCQLRGDWERTEVEHGDFVNVVGELSIANSYIVDNERNNYIIVHPDILITPTSISSSIRCIRRSILEKYFKIESQNEVMFLGTLVHSVFDAAITSADFSLEAALSKARELLKNVRTMSELYGLGVSEEEIMTKVKEKLTSLALWGNNHFQQEPHPLHGLISFKDGNTERTSTDDNVAVCISKVVDIEESVWSPKFGLKGNVDATVEVKINRKPSVMRGKTSKCETSILPLELKTGKLHSKLGSVEHRAQVILYSLLMRDRYPNSLDTGLLLYLKEGHMLGVPAYVHEKRALVMKRNEMVRYLGLIGVSSSQNMPAMLQDQRGCSYCSHLKVCTLYHKSVEHGDSVSAGIGSLFDKMTEHLSATHLEYFAHWNRLIALESNAIKASNHQPDLWYLSGGERERLGYCISNMVLESCELSANLTKADQFINKFVKPSPSTIAVSEMHLTTGDYVVVSQENGIIALATGFLQEVSENGVSVLLDKNLMKSYHHVTASQDTRYRIDKGEITTGTVTQWSTLAKLFFAGTEQDAKLRRLIVDLYSPRFSRPKNTPFLSSQGCCGPFSSQLSNCSISPPTKASQCDTEISKIFNGLNTDQRNAVRKVLAAQDYALILGMPGTGKTTTIACLVRALVALGKTVLLTSYTHSAVDNILLKLKKENMDFLRLGSVRKIHAEIQQYSVERAAEHVGNVAELKEFYESKMVVATTCLGVNDNVFQKLSFDYCIVDEASQITQPVCIGSLRHASMFVLVGDHYQLPPLVQSHEARDAGMDVSLFKRLSENHPQAVVNLEHQYRMHKDIMLLSNSLIYDGRLKCATDAIGECTLDLSTWQEFVEDMHRMNDEQKVNSTWLIDVLDAKLPVIFVNTDQLSALETRKERNVFNETEAALVATMTRALVTCGLDPGHVGVISPYRHQLKIIKQAMQAVQPPCLSAVEINTVDKYQGRDKQCILVSFVRSNTAGHVGDLLRDWRRVNVALTRAKHKLILVGSQETLKHNTLCQELFSLLQDRALVYNLPKDAWCGVIT